MTAGYLHEVWLCPDEEGQLLPACIPFGPSGDAARALNEQGSYCVWIFWADTHYEAMNIYYEFLGRSKYTTEQSWHHERYPVEWYEEQRAYLNNH